MSTQSQSQVNLSRTRRLFFILMFLGLLFRGMSVAARVFPEHDEAITLLAATGHQRAYFGLQAQADSSFGTWARASQLKRFIEQESGFRFRLIARDLGHHDFHPPLYFWLLHILFALLEAGLHWPLILNQLFDLASCVMLWILLKRLRFEPIIVWASVALLWLSPAVISTSNLARHYSLLGCVGLAFVCLMVRAVGREAKSSSYYSLAVAFVTLCGLLTHYYFTILVAGAAVYFVWGAVRTKVRKVQSNAQSVHVLLALGAGFLIFYGLHPYFWVSFGLKGAPEVFDPAEWLLRGGRFMVALAELFSMQLWLGSFIVIGYAILLLRALRRPRNISRRSLLESLGLSSVPRLCVGFMFAWTWGCIGLLYVSSWVPRHAMGGPYLALIWPLWIVILASLFECQKRARKPIYIIAAVALFSGVMLQSVSAFARNRSEQSLMTYLGSIHRVIVDNTARGKLLPLVYGLQDDTWIYAADQQYVIARSSEWLDMRDSRGVYIHLPGPRNIPNGSSKILELLSKRYDIVPEDHLPGAIAGEPLSVYSLRPSSDSSSSTIDQ